MVAVPTPGQPIDCGQLEGHNAFAISKGWALIAYARNEHVPADGHKRLILKSVSAVVSVTPFHRQAKISHSVNTATPGVLMVPFVNPHKAMYPPVTVAVSAHICPQSDTISVNGRGSENPEQQPNPAAMLLWVSVTVPPHASDALVE
jgi:hypothetical protein